MSAIAAEFHRSVADVAFTLTATLATRPIGALIFGWLADRYGRRPALTLDVIFYSAFEMMSGLAPNYRTFLLLRAVYGVGMGGEWGVGAALAMESAPTRWRGLWSGVLQQGYALGYLMAALAYFFVFPSLGWRALFFIGGLPALLTIYIRAGVPESLTRTRFPNSGATIWRAVRDNLHTFFYLVLLITVMSVLSHGTQDLYPTFLQIQRGLPPRIVAAIALVYNVGAILGGTLFGFLSDRHGRRRAMIIAALLGLLLVPLWLYPSALPLLILGAFLMQLMVQGVWGVVPAHLAELSPPTARGLFAGFAYQLGVLFSSAAIYLEALLAERLSYASALGLVATTVLVGAAIVVGLGHERKGLDLLPG
jgi:MFS transporter, SHS family, lactate transporter